MYWARFSRSSWLPPNSLIDESILKPECLQLRRSFAMYSAKTRVRFIVWEVLLEDRS